MKIFPIPPTDSKLTVIEQAPTHVTPNGSKVTRWKCRCECGNIVIVASQKLRSGHTKSCGCHKTKWTSEANITHGHAKIGNHTLTYRIWCAMNTRCTNRKQPHAKHYVDKGIRVCRFFSVFTNFLNTMGECPEGLSIDRIETNGNYSCGQCEECKLNGWKMNCRWATDVEQARNRSNNRMIKVHGKLACMAEHCEYYNIDRTLADYRLSKDWSPEKTFTYPVKKMAPRPIKTPVP